MAWPVPAATPDAAPAGALEPVPWRPVGAICGAVVGVLLLVARRYGWHRDELYFLQAGVHHLAWGYIDQPPFTPFGARIANDIDAVNLVVLRTLPALASAAGVGFRTRRPVDSGG